MNSEHWQRVKQILDHAIALEDSRRTEYLDRECAGELEVRREVESLIASHQQAGTGFLKDPAVDLHAVAAPARAGNLRVGPYQIVEQIGHGGMGEVYRAVRADGQYTKEVAIKLVRGGFDNAVLIDRFRNERQILASLDHPNIARLLDGGTTEEGVPYLVMELIEGTCVDAYCDAQKLSITERLQLFRQVCSAVQYAHQHLVIHRDIKPSNILVTKDGIPKLLDFGIAKLLDPAVTAETTIARPMTPEYASPEQIRGEPITTASDVYSLGVVLYLLLTGHSPYPGDTRSSHELALAVCDTDPARPSTAVLSPVTRNGEQITAERVSSSREGSPSKLRHRLAGDLDNIILRAIRKEPQRRYTSAEQLAEDLRRHLEGLPVIATRGSWRYRARKFVNRHRVAVAATAAVLLALLAGIGATAREARIAREQAQVARQQRARAEKRFNDVRQLSDSLIFDVHDAIQNLPGATPARKLLLDRAVEYLDSVTADSAGDPDLQRELGWGYQRLAVVQGSPTESNLGDLQASLGSDGKSLALFEAVAKAKPENVIDQLNVAMMHRILAFSALTDPSGRHDLDQAMAITDRLLKQGITDPRVRSERSVEYQNLALMQDAAGDRAQALDSYRKNQALKLDIMRTNPDYRKIRRSLGMATIMLGSALARMGDRQQALKAVQQGITYYEEEPKGDDEVNVRREVAVSKQKLGDILLMNGDYMAARASYRQARIVLAPLAKADPQNTLLQLDMAGMDYREARLLAATGQYRAAGIQLQQTAKVLNRLHVTARSADDSVPVGELYIWQGEVLGGAGDLRNSLQYYEKAISALEANLGSNNDDDTRCQLATGYVKAAAALARLGRLQDASAAYRNALKIFDEAEAVAKENVPALYVIAQAQAGVADLAAAQAKNTRNPQERTRLTEETRTFRQHSFETWRRIPNPARISPHGFLVTALPKSARRS